jgi:FkbM family methyltransferase
MPSTNLNPLRHPLNAKHKLKSLGNFLSWQIGTRILGKKVIVPWVDDAKFIAGSGETGLTGNVYVGFMEYLDMLFLLHALQPGETFVDVGANIGAYTILASKVVQSPSIAFEPLPGTADRLKDQLQINRIESFADVRNMGVGDAKGALFFTNNNDTTNKVSLEGDAQNTTRVEVSTLDAELRDDARYFFKIDVEGFEYNVLSGASHILSSDSISAIIIELNGSGEEFGHSNEDIHEKLTSYNFIPVAYEPLSRTLTKLDSYNKDSGNTIYVKDIDLISQRCRSAPRRIVHTACGMSL